MLKKTITYKDFNDNDVSEDLYFHFSKAELVELELSYEGGLEVAIQRIVKAQDGKAIINEFKKIILGSYGQRSEDGRRFVKNQELRDEFESTEAYSTLFMELVTSAEAAAEFVNGIVPQGMAEEAASITAQAPVLVEAPVPVAVEPREVSRKDMETMTAEEFSKLSVQIISGEVKLVD